MDFLQQITDSVNASNEVDFIVESHQDNLTDAANHLGQAFSEETNSRVKKLKVMSKGLHVFWKYKKEVDKFIQGEFNIFDPFTAFAYNDASTVIYSLPQAPDFLCYIDNHPIISDDVYAVGGIDAVKGVVLGYSDSGKVYTLSIDWEEYHSCLIHTLGYLHWQMLFALELSQDQVQWLNERYLPEMLADMQLCFPQKDMATFMALVKAKNPKLALDFF